MSRSGVLAGSQGVAHHGDAVVQNIADRIRLQGQSIILGDEELLRYGVSPDAKHPWQQELRWSLLNKLKSIPSTNNDNTGVTVRIPNVSSELRLTWKPAYEYAFHILTRQKIEDVKLQVSQSRMLDLAGNEIHQMVFLVAACAIECFESALRSHVAVGEKSPEPGYPHHPLRFVAEGTQAQGGERLDAMVGNAANIRSSEDDGTAAARPVASLNIFERLVVYCRNVVKFMVPEWVWSHGPIPEPKLWDFKFTKSDVESMYRGKASKATALKVQDDIKAVMKDAKFPTDQPRMQWELARMTHVLLWGLLKNDNEVRSLMTGNKKLLAFLKNFALEQRTQRENDPIISQLISTLTQIKSRRECRCSTMSPWTPCGATCVKPHKWATSLGTTPVTRDGVANIVNAMTLQQIVAALYAHAVDTDPINKTKSELMLANIQRIKDTFPSQVGMVFVACGDSLFGQTSKPECGYDLYKEDITTAIFQVAKELQAYRGHCFSPVKYWPPLVPSRNRREFFIPFNKASSPLSMQFSSSSKSKKDVIDVGLRLDGWYDYAEGSLELLHVGENEKDKNQLMRNPRRLLDFLRSELHKAREFTPSDDGVTGSNVHTIYFQGFYEEEERVMDVDIAVSLTSDDDQCEVLTYSVSVNNIPATKCTAVEISRDVGGATSHGEGKLTFLRMGLVESSLQYEPGESHQLITESATILGNALACEAELEKKNQRNVDTSIGRQVSLWLLTKLPNLHAVMMRQWVKSFATLPVLVKLLSVEGTVVGLTSPEMSKAKDLLHRAQYLVVTIAIDEYSFVAKRNQLKEIATKAAPSIVELLVTSPLRYIQCERLKQLARSSSLRFIVVASPTSARLLQLGCLLTDNAQKNLKDDGVRRYDPARPIGGMMIASSQLVNRWLDQASADDINCLDDSQSWEGVLFEHVSNFRSRVIFVVADADCLGDVQLVAANKLSSLDPKPLVEVMASAESQRQHVMQLMGENRGITIVAVVPFVDVDSAVLPSERNTVFPLIIRVPHLAQLGFVPLLGGPMALKIKDTDNPRLVELRTQFQNAVRRGELKTRSSTRFSHFVSKVPICGCVDQRTRARLYLSWLLGVVLSQEAVSIFQNIVTPHLWDSLPTGALEATVEAKVVEASLMILQSGEAHIPSDVMEPYLHDQFALDDDLVAPWGRSIASVHEAVSALTVYTAPLTLFCACPTELVALLRNAELVQGVEKKVPFFWADELTRALVNPMVVWLSTELRDHFRHLSAVKWLLALGGCNTASFSLDDHDLDYLTQLGIPLEIPKRADEKRLNILRAFLALETPSAAQDETLMRTHHAVVEYLQKSITATEIQALFASLDEEAHRCFGTFLLTILLGQSFQGTPLVKQSGGECLAQMLEAEACAPDSLAAKFLQHFTPMAIVRLFLQCPCDSDISLDIWRCANFTSLEQEFAMRRIVDEAGPEDGLRRLYGLQWNRCLGDLPFKFEFLGRDVVGQLFNDMLGGDQDLMASLVDTTSNTDKYHPCVRRLAFELHKGFVTINFSTHPDMLLLFVNPFVLDLDLIQEGLPGLDESSVIGTFRTLATTMGRILTRDSLDSLNEFLSNRNLGILAAGHVGLFGHAALLALCWLYVPKLHSPLMESTEVDNVDEARRVRDDIVAGREVDTAQLDRLQTDLRGAEWEQRLATDGIQKAMEVQRQQVAHDVAEAEKMRRQAEERLNDLHEAARRSKTRRDECRADVEEQDARQHALVRRVDETNQQLLQMGPAINEATRANNLAREAVLNAENSLRVESQRLRNAEQSLIDLAQSSQGQLLAMRQKKHDAILGELVAAQQVEFIEMSLDESVECLKILEEVYAVSNAAKMPLDKSLLKLGRDLSDAKAALDDADGRLRASFTLLETLQSETHKAEGQLEIAEQSLRDAESAPGDDVDEDEDEEVAQTALDNAVHAATVAVTNARRQLEDLQRRLHTQTVSSEQLRLAAEAARSKFDDVNNRNNVTKARLDELSALCAKAVAFQDAVEGDKPSLNTIEAARAQVSSSTTLKEEADAAEQRLEQTLSAREREAIVALEAAKVSHTQSQQQLAERLELATRCSEHLLQLQAEQQRLRETIAAISQQRGEVAELLRELKARLDRASADVTQCEHEVRNAEAEVAAREQALRRACEIQAAAEDQIRIAMADEELLSPEVREQRRIEASEAVAKLQEDVKYLKAALERTSNELTAANARLELAYKSQLQQRAKIAALSLLYVYLASDTTSSNPVIQAFLRVHPLIKLAPLATCSDIRRACRNDAVVRQDPPLSDDSSDGDEHNETELQTNYRESLVTFFNPAAGITNFFPSGDDQMKFSSLHRLYRGRSIDISSIVALDLDAGAELYSKLVINPGAECYLVEWSEVSLSILSPKEYEKRRNGVNNVQGEIKHTFKSYWEAWLFCFHRQGPASLGGKAFFLYKSAKSGAPWNLYLGEVNTMSPVRHIAESAMTLPRQDSIFCGPSTDDDRPPFYIWHIASYHVALGLNLPPQVAEMAQVLTRCIHRHVCPTPTSDSSEATMTQLQVDAAMNRDLVLLSPPAAREEEKRLTDFCAELLVNTKKYLLLQYPNDEETGLITEAEAATIEALSNRMPQCYQDEDIRTSILKALRGITGKAMSYALACLHDDVRSRDDSPFGIDLMEPVKNAFACKSIARTFQLLSKWNAKELRRTVNRPDGEETRFDENVRNVYRQRKSATWAIAQKSLMNVGELGEGVRRRRPFDIELCFDPFKWDYAASFELRPGTVTVEDDEQLAKALPQVLWIPSTFDVARGATLAYIMDGFLCSGVVQSFDSVSDITFDNANGLAMFNEWVQRVISSPLPYAWKETMLHHCHTLSGCYPPGCSESEKHVAVMAYCLAQRCPVAEIRHRLEVLVNIRPTEVWRRRDGNYGVLCCESSEGEMWSHTLTSKVHVAGHQDTEAFSTILAAFSENTTHVIVYGRPTISDAMLKWCCEYTLRFPWRYIVLINCDISGNLPENRDRVTSMLVPKPLSTFTDKNTTKVTLEFDNKKYGVEVVRTIGYDGSRPDKDFAAVPKRSAAVTHWCEDLAQKLGSDTGLKSVQIISPPGSGKTTLVKKLKYEMEVLKFDPKKRCRFVMFDCSDDRLVAEPILSLINEQMDGVCFSGESIVFVADEFHMLPARKKKEFSQWAIRKLDSMKMVLISNRKKFEDNYLVDAVKRLPMTASKNPIQNEFVWNVRIPRATVRQATARAMSKATEQQKNQILFEALRLLLGDSGISLRLLEHMDYPTLGSTTDRPTPLEIALANMHPTHQDLFFKHHLVTILETHYSKLLEHKCPVTYAGAVCCNVDSPLAGLHIMAVASLLPLMCETFMGADANDKLDHLIHFPEFVQITNGYLVHPAYRMQRWVLYILVTVFLWLDTNYPARNRVREVVKFLHDDDAKAFLRLQVVDFPGFFPVIRGENINASQPTNEVGRVLAGHSGTLESLCDAAAHHNAIDWAIVAAAWEASPVVDLVKFCELLDQLTSGVQDGQVFAAMQPGNLTALLLQEIHVRGKELKVNSEIGAKKSKRNAKARKGSRANPEVREEEPKTTDTPLKLQQLVLKHYPLARLQAELSTPTSPYFLALWSRVLVLESTEAMFADLQSHPLVTPAVVESFLMWVSLHGAVVSNVSLSLLQISDKEEQHTLTLLSQRSEQCRQRFTVKRSDTIVKFLFDRFSACIASQTELSAEKRIRKWSAFCSGRFIAPHCHFLTSDSSAALLGLEVALQHVVLQGPLVPPWPDPLKAVWRLSREKMLVEEQITLINKNCSYFHQALSHVREQEKPRVIVALQTLLKDLVKAIDGVQQRLTEEALRFLEVFQRAPVATEAAQTRGDDEALEKVFNEMHATQAATQV